MRELHQQSISNNVDRVDIYEKNSANNAEKYDWSQIKRARNGMK